MRSLTYSILIRNSKMSWVAASINASANPRHRYPCPTSIWTNSPPKPHKQRSQDSSSVSPEVRKKPHKQRSTDSAASQKLDSSKKQHSRDSNNSESRRPPLVKEKSQDLSSSEDLNGSKKDSRKKKKKNTSSKNLCVLSVIAWTTVTVLAVMVPGALGIPCG